MQFFHQILAFLSLLAVSSACLVLDATMDSQKSHFTGTLVDNGRQVCQWKSTSLSSASNFATCLTGFAAYVTKDGGIVGYSNNGENNV
jgi:hypothetical protein